VLFCAPFVWLAILLVVISRGVARRRLRFRLRAVGESRGGAIAGVSVVRLRWTGVVLSGGIAALGGAWLRRGAADSAAGWIVRHPGTVPPNAYVVTMIALAGRHRLQPRPRSAQPTAATVDESRGERGLTARSEVVQDRPLRWVESCLLRRR